MGEAETGVVVPPWLALGLPAVPVPVGGVAGRSGMGPQMERLGRLAAAGAAALKQGGMSAARWGGAPATVAVVRGAAPGWAAQPAPGARPPWTPVTMARAGARARPLQTAAAPMAVAVAEVGAAKTGLGRGSRGGALSMGVTMTGRLAGEQRRKARWRLRRGYLTGTAMQGPVNRRAQTARLAFGGGSSPQRPHPRVLTRGCTRPQRRQ